MLTYVLSKQGNPLMPCSPRTARKLLEEKKAKVVSREPFTIQLLFGSSGYKQRVTLGVDSGSKVAAFGAIANDTALYLSEVKLRQDIKSNMDQKRAFRRTRRSRKTRYREARFDNRRRDGWLTPTLQSKVNSHKREIDFIKKIIPVTEVVIETATFDIHKLTNPEVFASGYQEGRMKDFYNVKQYVLHRDGYACKKCNKNETKLQVHHIVFRSSGGTDSPDNLITLCQSCHSKLHLSATAEADSKKLSCKLKKTRTLDATQVSTIGAFLKKDLIFKETFGYLTKYKREILGLKKTHYNDALCAGLSDVKTVRIACDLFKKVHIAKGEYKLRNGSRSEKEIPTGKIMGIKKFDKVISNGVTGFVKGRMSTGYAILMDIDGQKLDLKPIPKLKNMKRIAARKSCLTSRTSIKSTEKSFSHEKKQALALRH